MGNVIISIVNYFLANVSINIKFKPTIPREFLAKEPKEPKQKPTEPKTQKENTK